MSDIAPEISPQDFAASVADLISGGGAEDSADAEPAADTSVTEPATTADAGDTTTDPEPGLREDAAGNLHGPDGKFVPKDAETSEEDDQEVEETPEDDGEVQPLEWEIDLGDPDVSALLEKYGNDLGKALKGAAEAQRMVGRQSGELGELRKLQGEMEALKSILPQLAAARQPVAPQVDYTSMIENDPRAAAHAAARAGDIDTMMTAVKVWAQESPEDAFEAATFVTNLQHSYELEQLESRMNERLAAAQPQPSQQDETREVAAVLQRHPDLEKFLPAIGQIAKERPLLQQALTAGSPQEKASALEDLYLIARSRDTDTSADAVRRARVRAAEEGARARADASVVSASRGSAAAADQPTRVDQFLDAFEAKARSRGLLADE